MLGEADIAAHLQHWMFADRVMGRKKCAELQSSHMQPSEPVIACGDPAVRSGHVPERTILPPSPREHRYARCPELSLIA
jgi:hypothetical protein